MQVDIISLQGGESPDLSVINRFQAFDSILIQVFSSLPRQEQLIEVLDLLAERLPQAVIVGASSDAVVTNSTILDYGSLNLTIIGFESTTLKFAYLENAPDSHSAGELLARELGAENARLFITFCDAESINGEEYIKGIHAVAPDVLIAGGVAATPTFTDTFVVAGTRVIPNGAVMISLSSDSLQVYTDQSFGWQPVGQEYVVTKATANRVDEISYQTPAALFRHYLGDGVVDAMPGAGSAFPLMLKRGNDLIARGIIGVEGESFVVSGNICEGDSVYIGYGNPKAIANENLLTDRLRQNFSQPDIIFAYYCIGRKLFLPRNVVEYEIDKLGTVAPTAGLFTLGEFYTRDQPHLLNFSSTIVSLREGANHQEYVATGERLEPPMPDVYELVADGLFTFIDVRTRELSSLAYYDDLTGLPNHRSFNNVLSDAIARASIKATQCAVLVIGINKFSQAHERGGHQAGDALLQSAARALHEAIGEQCVLARLEHSKFIALLENITSLQDIQGVIDRVATLLSEPINVGSSGKNKFYLSVNIGAAAYPDNGQDADTIIKHATICHGAIRDESKNNFKFFSPAMLDDITRRSLIEDGMREALEDDQFHLCYQPKIDIKTGELTGAEALIRWDHPTLGPIPPTEFIPVAEECGLIELLGTWVLLEACRQAKVWQDAYKAGLKIAVNLSARQLDSKFLYQKVMQVIDATGLPPELLELEVTESMLLNNIEQTIECFDNLRRHGITISLDDFGTGYSSLSYLKRLPVEHLKIDRSFISELEQNENDASIVSAIILMGHILGLRIIAEGVENEVQLNLLKQNGCDEFQGYLYSPPIRPEAFEAFIKNNRA
ncbi:EAL domain-containing protein [Pseudomaricurvus sp. HS19]|uniref:bifunctional diguanylate cyclase/phosphodiesterase n=1 Tax=Pseudomaricurvus sp. HS19 TaxID=2692626 RepID=UPI001370E688|nr:EAL domain-containing protein [Pseudomaricurvus sp. HS19]MYM62974.1 EAL domain-containing protein [Pseudomaricurvus sp. HS19]